MKDLCEKIDEFAAGELNPYQAAAFREHLVDCKECPRELSTILQFAALARAARATRGGGQQKPILTVVDGNHVTVAVPRRRAARWRLPAAGAFLVAAVLVVFAMTPARAPTPTMLVPITPTSATNRSIDGRLSLAWADHYRPFNAGLLASQHHEPNHQFLADQQRAGDNQGLATSHMLVREFSHAKSALAAAGDSAGVRSDKAALALEHQSPGEALSLVDEVIAHEPRHPQALWNRAIALEQMGLDLTAAESFDRVAALGEAGWSAEATKRAQGLRAQAKARHSGWDSADAAGAALVNSGAAIPEIFVERNPDIIRIHFYDAINSAPSRQRVLALGPLALRLDVLTHDRSLERLVAKVAQADFKVRAPLGRRFLDVLRGRVHLDGEAFDRFLASIRRANQPDVLLGAIAFAPDREAHRAEMQRLDEKTGDPWYVARARMSSAQLKAAAGALPAATEELRVALAECRGRNIEYRCSVVAEALAILYQRTYLPASNRRNSDESRRLAKAGQLWEREAIFLQFLADAARFDRSYSVAHAYLDEVAVRFPDDCVMGQVVRMERAVLDLYQLRPAAARRESLGFHGCSDRPPQVATADILADLSHWGGTDEEFRRVQTTLDETNALPGLSPSFRAHAKQIRGQILAERDPEAARAFLKAAIADANLGSKIDTELLRVRASSYASLLELAGGRNAWGEALALMAEERDVTAPANCALGVSVRYDAVLVAARMSGGEFAGTYENHHSGAIQPSNLVSAGMIAGFTKCHTVEVFARPPLQGIADLLPAGVPWTYRTRPEAPLPKSLQPAKRLIVSGIRAPQWLSEELAPTAPWSPLALANVHDAELSSPDATPSRVRLEMGDATDIEIHAHGMQLPDHSDVSLLVLSPDHEGKYALTDTEVLATPLRRAPIVYLASCGAALTSPTSHAPASLPMAFLDAGARAVLASPSPMDDGEAGPFYDSVRARISSGEPPAEALRDAKLQWLRTNPASQVKAILLFQ